MSFLGCVRGQKSLQHPFRIFGGAAANADELIAAPRGARWNSKTDADGAVPVGTCAARGMATIMSFTSGVMDTRQPRAVVADEDLPAKLVKHTALEIRENQWDHPPGDAVLTVGPFLTAATAKETPLVWRTTV